MYRTKCTLSRTKIHAQNKSDKMRRRILVQLRYKILSDIVPNIHIGQTMVYISSKNMVHKRIVFFQTAPHSSGSENFKIKAGGHYFDICSSVVLYGRTNLKLNAKQKRLWGVRGHVSQEKFA